MGVGVALCATLLVSLGLSACSIRRILLADVWGPAPILTRRWILRKRGPRSVKFRSLPHKWAIAMGALPFQKPIAEKSQPGMRIA